MHLQLREPDICGIRIQNIRQHKSLNPKSILLCFGCYPQKGSLGTWNVIDLWRIELIGKKSFIFIRKFSNQYLNIDKHIRQN